MTFKAQKTAVGFFLLVVVLLEIFLPGLLNALNTPTKTYDIAGSYPAMASKMFGYTFYAFSFHKPLVLSNIPGNSAANILHSA